MTKSKIKTIEQAKQKKQPFFKLTLRFSMWLKLNRNVFQQSKAQLRFNVSLSSKLSHHFYIYKIFQFNHNLIDIMKKHTVVLLMLAFILANANIWDNVYSQAKASMPIILQEAINMQFSVRQYSSKINIDYNPQLQLITMGVFFDLLLMKMQVLRAEVDLHQLIFTFKRQGAECQRFKLAMFQKMELGTANLNKQRIFLINIFFKFLGESQRGGQALNKYQFEPFILGKNSTQFQNFTNQINKGINKELQDVIDDEIGDDFKEKIENIDFFDLKDDFFVYTDKVKGTPRYITLSQKGKASKEANIPFKLFSNVEKPFQCKTETKTLTNQQLKDMLVKAFKGIGDLTKFFK